MAVVWDKEFSPNSTEALSRVVPVETTAEYDLGHRNVKLGWKDSLNLNFSLLFPNFSPNPLAKQNSFICLGLGPVYFVVNFFFLKAEILGFLSLPNQV